MKRHDDGQGSGASKTDFVDVSVLGFRSGQWMLLPGSLGILGMIIGRAAVCCQSVQVAGNRQES